MLSIEENILKLNSLRLLPVAALRFTLYTFYRCPKTGLPHLRVKAGTARPGSAQRYCQTPESCDARLYPTKFVATQ